MHHHLSAFNMQKEHAFLLRQKRFRTETVFCVLCGTLKKSPRKTIIRVSSKLLTLHMCRCLFKHILKKNKSIIADGYCDSFLKKKAVFKQGIRCATTHQNSGVMSHEETMFQIYFNNDTCRTFMDEFLP